MEYETTFKSRLKSYRINNYSNTKIPLDFLKENIVIRKKRESLEKYNGLNVNFKIFCLHKRNENDIQEFTFKTENTVILAFNDFNTFYDFVIEKLINEADDFVSKGSGWSLAEIRFLELRINKYEPLEGATYIDLPKKIKKKQAIINVKNKDNKCFIWSILLAIHPVTKHPQRESKYEKYKYELNFKGIEFPVSLDDIKKFEKLSNISVNVYGYESLIYPLRITKNKLEKHLNLFYMKDDKNGHY